MLEIEKIWNKFQVLCLIECLDTYIQTQEGETYVAIGISENDTEKNLITRTA